MKRILLLFLVLPFFGSAQSFQIAHGDSLVTGDATTSYDIESHINITNISNRTKDVLVKRIDKNYNALTDSNAICWDVCFTPETSVSPISIEVKAGETTDASGFIGHVYPDGDGYNRVGPITYVFYDESNPNDSVAWTVYYELTGGVDAVSLPERKPALIKVYPNPASDILNIQYDLQESSAASVELVNMLGQQVYGRSIKDSRGELQLDVSKLSRGVYFYILRSEGEAVLTKKLVLE